MKVISYKAFVSACLITSVLYMVYVYYEINALQVKSTSGPIVTEISDDIKELSAKIYELEKQWAADAYNANCNCPIA